MLLVLCWFLVGVFLVFQYSREKTFRTELLDMKLQMYNSRIADILADSGDMTTQVAEITPPMEHLRLSLIDASGKVVYDNNDSTPFPSTNHNDRPEIIKARREGKGYSVERMSESDNTEYFYSAMLGKDGMVIRSAAPYDHNLRSFLSADRTFLWIMLALTLAVSFVGYFISRRISTSISRLNKFAEKAGNGGSIYDDWSFPNDELGSIASHIVRLYVQREQHHREAIEQERDKIRLKKQLTNNINHELKTPVASIMVCAELLTDHPELPEVKRAEFIRRICASARRLDSMLRDVMSVTRMDDGAAMIEKEPVDLADIVSDVAENERLRTDMFIGTDVPHIVIQGNRNLLESLFRNLIDNAIAYSGGTEISIRADKDGIFTVRDNGCGIPDKCLPHIFERFYRVDKGRSRAAGGTGLGLAIVKNVVLVHGGGQIIASNDGGLRFDFRLC